jgi:hypothetical protein
MSDPSPRVREIFFEVYEDLPRQGPGHRACAARALGLWHELPGSPAILDLGCGLAPTRQEFDAPDIKRILERAAPCVLDR